MGETSRAIFTTDWMPHGFCINWSPQLLWTYALSDGAIFLSYYSIPLALVYFAVKRHDLSYKKVLWLFAAFILACGTTHLMGVFLLWKPLYSADAAVKVVTAALSIATAVYIWPVLPKLLALPNPDRLLELNYRLEQEMKERRNAEAELIRHRDHLQELVEQKTRSLQEANASLTRALHEEEAIYEGNPDILYVANTQARLIKWNKKMEEVTGYSTGELMGKECVSFFPPEETDLIAKAIGRVFTEGKGEAEGHFLTKSGTSILYHFNGVLLKNQNNEIVGFTGTGRDIAERKRAEETLQQIQKQLLHAEKLSALGKLTGSIAHEFNNPIYGIRNVLEQISDSPHMNEEDKKLTALAVKECNRMADLVRRLREFYKPSQGIKTWLDIHQTLDDTLLLMKKDLNTRKIQLMKNYAPNLPKIKVVEDQMKQVFLNLIQNAEDATPPEGGTITITSETPDSNTVKISVEDTGEGIPPGNLELIFDPFFSTKAIKGTGLGLSVCHGIINSLGGKIEAKSELGKGAAFILHIPIDTPAIARIS